MIRNPQMKRPTTMRMLRTLLIPLLALVAAPTPAPADPLFHIPPILGVYHAALGTTTPVYTGAASWTTGLGAIAHLTGPTDQAFKLVSGAAASGTGNALQLTAGSGFTGANVGGPLNLSAGLAGQAGTAGGNIVFQSALSGAGTSQITILTLNNTGSVQWPTGLGALNHLLGPTDQTFAVAAGAARGFTLTGNLASTITTTAGNTTVDSAASLLLGSTATTVTISGTNPAASISVGTGALTIASTAATTRAGLRNANTRNIIRAGSVAPPDCAGAGLGLTVTQFLDAGIATCGTTQTITFPTWQGAAGIVQGLPGTPAVGDMVEFVVVASAANAVTVAAGTGGTLGGSATVPANTDKIYRCRITAITTNSETATCY